MKKTKLDRIINLIREDMMGGGGAGAPTMNTGSTTGKPGFSSKADAEGPTAGFDPLLGKKKKRKPTPVGRYGTRRTWKQNSES